MILPGVGPAAVLESDSIQARSASVWTSSTIDSLAGASCLYL